MRSITEIASLIEAKDWANALRAATALWRRSRDTNVAALVDALDERQTKTPIHHYRSIDDFQEAWVARAEEDDELTLGELAVAACDGVRWNVAGIETLPPWRERLAALARKPHDPRTALALTEMLQTPPHWATRDGAFGDAFRSLLVALADRRTAAVLRGIDQYGEAADAERKALANAVETASARYEALRTNEANRIRTLIEKVRATPADGGPLAALYAKVLANLDDDDALAVYADALSEHGDPRGEFIALQLRATTKGLTSTARGRMSAILGEHEERWIGATTIASTVRRHWRRGLLDGIDLMNEGNVGAHAWRRFVESDALHTVRLIDQWGCHANDFTALLARAKLPALRHVKLDVDGFDAESFAALRAIPLPLTELTLAGDLRKPVLDELADARANLPGLARLNLVAVSSNGPARFAKNLVDARLVQGLDELVLTPETWFTNDEDLAPWLETLASSGVVRRVVLRTKHVDVTITSSGAARTVECETERGWDVDVLRRLRKIGRLTLRDRKARARPLANARELHTILGEIGAKHVELPPAWQKQLDALPPARARKAR